jgi:transcriptional regulator with XRE-family HTH domain
MKNEIAVDVNRRVKEIRHALKMTQVKFAKVISLSNGYFAGIEVEKRRVNDRHIKLICSAFGADETWLKTGMGAMFRKNPDERFTKLVALFKELDPKFQNYILKQIDLLLEMQEGVEE